MTTRVIPIETVAIKSMGETLCFQHCVYNENNGKDAWLAYRFVRKNAKGHHKAQRGQAAITEIEDAVTLINMMLKKLGMKEQYILK